MEYGVYPLDRAVIREMPCYPKNISAPAILGSLNDPAKEAATTIILEFSLGEEWCGVDRKRLCERIRERIQDEEYCDQVLQAVDGMIEDGLLVVEHRWRGLLSILSCLSMVDIICPTPKLIRPIFLHQEVVDTVRMGAKI